MQQYCLISLRYKNPLHKHIHNFAFPDGGNAPAAPAADEDMDGLYGDVDDAPASAPAPETKPAEDDDLDDMYDAWCVC